MNVMVPARFTRDTLPHFFDSLDVSRDLDNVGIDFQFLRYSYPIAMLVAGSKLRDWWLYRSGCGYESYQLGISGKISAHSYLMHMGFFDFIYMTGGNRVGQALGSSRYLPITRILRPSADVHETGLDGWYEAIEAEARRLGGLLVGSYDDSEELRTYTYCIREIIRNVFEHSGASECYICGQRWWSGKVEIALVDEGIGICNSLRESHGIVSDRQALSLAIRPGISRTNMYSEEQNVYENSGFGLYVLAELAASFGWFTLGSGWAQLIGYQHNWKIGSSFGTSSFDGTFFGMQLEHPPSDFRSVLNDIIEAGEQEARLAGINIRASGRSRLIGS